MSQVKQKRSLLYRVARGISVGLVAAVGVLNFTPLVSKLSALDDTDKNCTTATDLLKRPKNDALVKAIKVSPTAQEIFSFAVSTEQKVCQAKVSDGAVAQYFPDVKKTIIDNINHIGKGQKDHDSVTTLGHEFYHAFQAASAPLSAELMARRYDARSNVVAGLYMEAAAYAFETMIAYEYFQKNPQKKKDLEYTMLEELLGVFEKSMKTNKNNKNLSARAVFEYFLNADIGPILLAHEYYFSAYKKPWYKMPHRLLAFREATLEEIAPLTRLPNGFQLYAYDHLPTAEEVARERLIPEKVDRKPVLADKGTMRP